MDRRKAERVIMDYALTRALFKHGSPLVSDEVAEAKEFVGDVDYLKIYKETEAIVLKQKEIMNVRD